MGKEARIGPIASQLLGGVGGSGADERRAGYHVGGPARQRVGDGG